MELRLRQHGFVSYLCCLRVIVSDNTAMHWQIRASWLSPMWRARKMLEETRTKGHQFVVQRLKVAVRADVRTFHKLGVIVHFICFSEVYEREDHTVPYFWSSEVCCVTLPHIEWHYAIKGWIILISLHSHRVINQPISHWKACHYRKCSFSIAVFPHPPYVCELH